MILEHYWHKIWTFVSKPEDDIISVTNILKEEFYVEYQWSDLVIKSWETKSFIAQKWFSIAKIIATTYCKKELNIQPVSKKYVEIFNEVIWMKAIEYWTLELETLKQIASEKKISLIDENWKQKVKAKIIEELWKILFVESATEEKLKMINAKKANTVEEEKSEDEAKAKIEEANNKAIEAEEKAKALEARIAELEANAKKSEKKVVTEGVLEDETEEVKKTPKKKAEKKEKEDF